MHDASRYVGSLKGGYPRTMVLVRRSRDGTTTWWTMFWWWHHNASSSPGWLPGRAILHTSNNDDWTNSTRRGVTWHVVTTMQMVQRGCVLRYELCQGLWKWWRKRLCGAGEEYCDDQVTRINQGVGPPFSKWGCVGGWILWGTWPDPLARTCQMTELNELVFIAMGWFCRIDKMVLANMNWYLVWSA